MEQKRHDTDYLFLTTRVRALECALLDQGRMDQMLEAPTIEDAARILIDCGYPELEQVNSDTVNQMLAQERARCLEDLGQLLPEPAILAIFQLPQDYHNVKVLLKAEAIGAPPETLQLMTDTGRVPTRELTGAVTNRDLRDLPLLLAEAITEARQVLSSTRDPQLGDLVLDRYYFQELQNLAQETGSDFLADYVALTIDTANLRTVVRVLRMGRGREQLEGILCQGGELEVQRLLEGVSSGIPLEDLYAASSLQQAAEAGSEAVRGGSLTKFEKLCDDGVTEFLRQSRLVAFGEAPVIAYLAAKEMELTSIRIIMTSRLAGLPAEVIRERLREAYV